MLTNLVSNAIKYHNTKVKSIIMIELKETDQSILLSISDNGLGIAAEDLPKIFSCFYRTKNSYLEQGTGLGLAIVEKIVLKHNGTISASSILGIRTEFLITFPKIVNK